MMGIKYSYNASLFYVHCKKHFCPKCGAKVELGNEIKTVNSNSPEAKNYNFHCVDTYRIGDVKFITRCFYCPDCQVNISFKDMKKYERELKRRNKKKQRKYKV